MFRKIIKYFSSLEMFVKFQYGLRRRILDTYNKLMYKKIVRTLNNLPKCETSIDEFTNRIPQILEIPSFNNDADYNRHTEVAIVNQANKAIDGIFNLLGSGDIELNPILWHTDFKVGYKWNPGTFYRNYVQEGIDSDSDVKVPRELSRCHHLIKLGLAYRLTNDEKYAATCISQISDWIQNNPLMYSINWGCTMDVAIRAVNWIWALGLVAGSKTLDKEKLEKIRGSLYQHGWFIFRNPEKAPFNNHNHYLSDLAGQIHLGLFSKA